MKLPDRLPSLVLYAGLGLPTLAAMIGCGPDKFSAFQNQTSNNISLATVAPRPSNLADSNIYTLYELPSRTNLNGADCGSVGQTTGCYGQETVSSLNLPGAFVRGVPSAAGDVITRTNYVLNLEDTNSPSGASLTVFNATQTIAGSSDSIAVTGSTTIPLKDIIGGPITGILDASSQSVYAATAGTPNLQIITKAGNSVTNLGLSSTISGISTDREDFTVVTTDTAGSLSSVLLGRDNAQLAQANGIIVAADTRNGEEFTDAANTEIQICNQTAPTTICHDLAAAGSFGATFKIVETEPVLTNNSLSRQFIVWSVEKQTLFIVKQTDMVTGGVDTDTISPMTMIPVPTMGGTAGTPLLAASDSKIFFGSTNDPQIYSLDIATQTIKELPNVISATALPTALSADDYGNVTVDYGNVPAFAVYSSEGAILADGGGTAFMVGTNRGVSFTTTGAVIPDATQPVTIKDLLGVPVNSQVFIPHNQ